MWIYRIINDVNGKCYIGQTIRPVRERFDRHINDAVNGKLDTHFARAIRKYGKKHFHIGIIDSATNQEDLTSLEQFWIRKYNAVDCGYNETDAISKCGGNTYKSKTPQELSKIREKIREAKMGGKNPNARQIKATDVLTGEEAVFDSIIGCARHFGIKSGKTSIQKHLSGHGAPLYKKRYKFEYCNAESVSTIPDECMGVGSEISTDDVLGNEASENRSGRRS